MANIVILIGNLGKDPEVRYTSGGTAVCDLSVATEEVWFDKTTKEKKKETEWHTVTVWGKAAEHCGEYLAKGKKVMVRGKIKTDKYEDKKSGETKYRTKVVADMFGGVEFLSPKGEGGGRRQEQQGGPSEPSGFDGGGGGGPDDIPFAPFPNI